MKLEVLKPKTEKDPWYVDGLNFTCTQCGNCCTGPTGFVWISPEEIERLAQHLDMSEKTVVETYCRHFAGRISLKECRTPEGNYDCVFLKELPVGEAATKETLPERRKGCSIYNVRPLQCRTWPFWPENLRSPENWEHSSKRCHGMGQGRRHFSLRQIESLRDAQDWPKNPPTSETGVK